MKIDTYTLVARIFPAILSSFPLFVLHYFLFSPKLGGFWEGLLGIKVIGNTTVAFVFLFFIVQVSRLVSKEYFEKRIYKEGLYFPTTTFLLHVNSNFSPEYTNHVHKRIKTDFGIDVSSLRGEVVDESRSRKKIAEAVGYIRAKVGKGNLTGQHNTEYGFFRNLAGGALVATIISLVNIIIFGILYFNMVALLVTCSLTVAYILYLIFAKRVIDIVGKNYAKILIQEYMSL